MVMKVVSIIALLNLSLWGQVIYHNGFMYGFVHSPYTGKVWLDKNIGAQRVCLDSDDEACYGDLFQWGRNTDGHEKDTITMTKTQASKMSHLDYPFIIATKKNNRDWAKKIDKDGTKRQSHWSRIDGEGICPVGFRVPTIEELESETIDDGKVYDSKTAFQSFLKLPSSGYRSSDNSVLINRGERGYLWSSSINGFYAYNLHLSSEVAEVYTHNRADAMAVRCIRNK